MQKREPFLINGGFGFLGYTRSWQICKSKPSGSQGEPNHYIDYKAFQAKNHFLN